REKIGAVAVVLPETRAVVEHLRENSTLVCTAEEFRFDEIDLSGLVHGKCVNEAVSGRKLFADDDEPEVFLDFFERQTAWVFDDIFLQELLVGQRLEIELPRPPACFEQDHWHLKPPRRSRNSRESTGRFSRQIVVSCSHVSPRRRHACFESCRRRARSCRTSE